MKEEQEEEKVIDKNEGEHLDLESVREKKERKEKTEGGKERKKEREKNGENRGKECK